MRRRQIVGRLAQLVLLTVVYVVAGKLGLRLAFVHASASAVWPPTGIALAALLLWGVGLWPAVFVGAFVVNATTAGSLATSLGIAAGNTLEAVAGAYLVNRYARGRWSFERSRDVFRFAGLAALGSTTVSATSGVGSLLLGGFMEPVRSAMVWLTWWLGDMASDLLLAPVIVLWFTHPRLRWSARRGLETAGVTVAIVLTALLVFGGVLPEGWRNYPLNFLCIPVLLWPAFRLGQRESATAALLFTSIAIAGTLRGVGPFARDSPNEALLLLQSFVTVVSFTVVTVGAVVAERRRLEVRLLRLADHDPLTNLFSRRRLQEELRLTLAQAHRYGTSGTLLFLDLDDFKSVNDALGHRAGDRALIALAQRLRARLRHSDVLARMGGDEFAVLLPHTDRVQGQALAAQLLDAIRSHPIDLGGRRVAISATIGMALFPAHGTTTDELLANADRAMYRAKNAGGSRCAVHAPDEQWQKAIEASFRSETQLRVALDQGRFLFQGQPILDLRRDRVPHYELLLRMVGQDDELLPPAAFLGEAERCGLLMTIERWAVQRAIRLLGRDGHGPHPYALSVNLSGRAFSDGELLALIERELTTTGIAPARLVLEMSESSAVAELDHAREFAIAAKGLGCRLALDDFGVATSSLHHLAQLPVDYFKIDGSFIQNVSHSPVERQLIRAVVEMAVALDRQTVAESVADEATLRVLRACGVDYAQGYHVGRPCALAELFPGRVGERRFGPDQERPRDGADPAERRSGTRGHR
jgi:diguanylate cyclase (GGDEF)-like protein